MHTATQIVAQIFVGFLIGAIVWPPLTNLARLIEEVGELARELNHRYGHKPKKADEPEQDLALELADILFVLVAIANEQGIDLEEAFQRVLHKYDTRDRNRWTRLDPP